MKSLPALLGWIALFALSISVGWYVAQPTATEDSSGPTVSLAKAKPLYVSHCARCHGADGHGDPAMMLALKPPPRDFRERPWKHPITAASIRDVILNGIPETAMAPYRGLISREQADLLAGYVLELSEAESKPVPQSGSESTSAPESSSFRWHETPPLLPDAELVDADGQRLSLAEAGKTPLLIHFWGTTCVHCLAEMAKMQSEAGAERQASIRIISICVDSTQASEAAELVERFAPGHAVYVDPSGLVGQRFGVSALPAYRVVNAGNILASHVGTLPWEQVDLQQVSDRAKTYSSMTSDAR